MNPPGSFGTIHRRRFLALLSVLIAVPPALGETLSGKDLVAALRAGGNVIVMRHASSPREPPDASSANADNPRLERQLDQAGRSSAQGMGEALRHLKIPSVKYCRAPPIARSRRSNSRSSAK